ncbi:MAG: hypothetical protein JST52_08140 [Bacteroidetes bacterium]|nr:hypothetical protein [Bacteroidota bacterium]MBS1740033.1 hypothetical protein [Bacteroidota bacterium]
MKLLLITSIVEYKNDIKQILRNAEVHSYSYREVTGFKNAAADAIEANWFATNMTENESVLFYAFVPVEKVQTVLNDSNAFNARQYSQSYIHVAVISIEQSN